MIGLDPAPPRPFPAHDRRLLAAWAAILVGAVLAPRIHGFLSTPEGGRYVGFVGAFRNDYWSYLAWIRQGLDGEILFRNLFTSEPHAAAFFHPLFWSVGALARVTGLPVMAGWVLAEVVGVVLLVFAVARFAAEFTDDAVTRRLAVVLSTTTSGLGWLVAVSSGAPWAETPIDLWMPEANAFFALHSSFFTLPISLALMLLAMVQALRYFRSGRIAESAIGGVYALLLGAVHQYDVVTLFAVLGVWTLIAGPRFYGGMIVAGLVVLPAAAYGALMLTVHPVFSRVVWSMPVPTVGAHLLGFGAPLALSVVGLCHPAIRRDNRNLLALACWLAVVPVLLALPLGFQRKLIWGAQVPMAVVTAMVLRHWVWRPTHGLPREGRLRRWAPAVALAAALAFLAAGSARHYVALFTRNAKTLFGDYLPEPYYESFEWLGEHVGDEDVILAYGRVSPMIPGNTGKTVYFGHWAQTLDPAQKRAFAERVFARDASVSPRKLASDLATQRIRYVVEDAAGFEDDRAWRARVRERLGRLAVRVYENELVSVWSVAPEGRTD